jgi:hypothetical protein
MPNNNNVSKYYNIITTSFNPALSPDRNSNITS